MNVARRNKKLRALLNLRLGPGAAILPHDIKSIRLEFAYRLEGGHYGPRKFWRQCLPRLKYHNPAVSMTVHRSPNQESPAILSIRFATTQEYVSRATSSKVVSQATESTSPSQQEPSNDVEQIDVKNLHESEILQRLLDITRARPYEASTEEMGELQEVEEFEKRSEADRNAQDKLNKAKAQERAILEKAKGAVS